MRIIDTSVMVSAIERKDQEAITYLDQMEDLSIRSLIVLGELESRVQTSADDAAVLATRRRTLSAYRIASKPVPSLPLEPLAARFGELTAVAHRHGIEVGQNDRWILSEAMHWDVPIWTADEPMHALGLAVRNDGFSVLIG